MQQYDDISQKITVLGGGSAGFIAALTLKRKIPGLQVTVIRSPHLGIIGVGEGTTPNFPKHFHEYLGLKPEKFFAEAHPIWKLGIRYLWGPRNSFNYTFTNQTDYRYKDLPKNNGYYCDDDSSSVDLSSALMDEKRIFARPADGTMRVLNHFGYHKWGQSLDLNILIDVTGVVGWHAAWSDYQVHGQASGVD